MAGVVNRIDRLCTEIKVEALKLHRPTVSGFCFFSATRCPSDFCYAVGARVVCTRARLAEGEIVASTVLNKNTVPGALPAARGALDRMP